MRAMRSRLGAALCATLAVAGTADAQSADPGRQKPPLPARTGFQAHVATGIAVPAGRASDEPGDTLARRYSWQWPLEIGLGGKPSEALYLGGILGFGLGVEGSDASVEQACDDNDQTLDNEISCSAARFFLGAEARWSFEPEATVNPWLSLGVGWEFATQELHDRVRRRRENTTASGLIFPNFGAGLDFRRAKAIGFGPALNVAAARYTHTKTEVNGRTEYDGAIDDTAWHAWITLSLRMVFLP